MKTKLLSVAALLLGFSTMAQEPQITEWIFNTDGATASYDDGTGVTQLTDLGDIISVDYNATTVYITCEGLSSDQAGPWPVPDGLFYVEAQGNIYEIPRYPTEETGNKTGVPAGGVAAIATNGVAMFGYESSDSYSNADGNNTTPGDGIWNNDAWVNEGFTMDDNAAHPAAGEYHYHSAPSNLWSGSTTEHSEIVGWALDGFPIYGPYGYDDPDDTNSSIVRIESGYALRNITQRRSVNGQMLPPPEWGPDVTTNGNFDLGIYVEDYEWDAANGHLDEYNGRFCKTPEFPDGIYAYFTTIDASGEPAHPYILASSYYGEVPAGTNNRGGATIAPDAVNYDPTVTATEELITEEMVSVFPNPTNAFVNISAPVLESVQLLNGTGQVLYFGTDSEINVEGFEPGIYQLVITAGHSIVTKSIVITD